jgi:hypothetical protein
MDEQRRQQKREQQEARAKGERAEKVANWYFRLNGFLSIPGFIVHLDHRHAEVPADGRPRIARTEADFMSVRFPNSREEVGGRLMVDDPTLTQLAVSEKGSRILFVLVEVKTSRCRMNGPWTNRHKQNMQRVIRRLGFTGDEQDVERIASAMYDNARWENDYCVLQYICIGGQKDPRLSKQFQGLVQIDWQDVASFLLRRFQEFPEKLPEKHVHDQWPDFGRRYATWFTGRKNSTSPQESKVAVQQYIDIGRCEMASLKVAEQSVSR